MWTRSAQQKDGTFAITVWDNDGAVYLRRGGFTSAREADKAGELAQRDVLFGLADCDMTDDELLVALGVGCMDRVC